MKDLDKQLVKNFDAGIEIVDVSALAWTDEPAPKKPYVWKPRIQANTQDMGEPSCEDWVVSPPVEDHLGQPVRGSGAMPYWKYPAPGQPSTRELDQREDTESTLHITANMDLRFILLYLQMRQAGSLYANDSMAASAAKRLEFLKGLWLGKNIRVPSDEELNAMALRPRGTDWFEQLTHEQKTKAKSFKYGRERWKYLMEVRAEQNG